MSRYRAAFAAALTIAACHAQAATTINSPNNGNTTFFGQFTVALGDVTGDTVGDFYIADQAASSFAGAGYIYSGADFTQKTAITSLNSVNSGLFGGAVRIADTNSNSASDVLIRAPNETASTIVRAGHVYVADIASAATPGVTLTAYASPAPEMDGAFGNSIAVIQDVNSDSINDYVVGAPGENSAAGRVYILSGANPATVLQTIASPNSEAGGYFGYRIAMLPDINADGKDEIIIGAPYEDIISDESAGRTYVMSYSGVGSPTLLYTITYPLSGSKAYKTFADPTVIGDINTDGKADIIIGTSEHSIYSSSGNAYLFSGADGTYINMISPPDPTTDGWFGKRQNIPVPDMNNDSVQDFAIGMHTNVGGRTYFFSGSDLSLISSTTGTYPYSAGDLDGDGLADLMVGATNALLGYDYSSVIYHGSIADIHTASNPFEFGIRDPAAGPGQSRTLEISNQGLAAIQVSSINLGGANSADFGMSDLSAPVMIPGQGNITGTFTFDPSANGERTATLTVNSNDVDEAAYAVTLTGDGYAYPMGDVSQRAIVGGSQCVVEADLATGNRTVISGLNWSTSNVTGTGPALSAVMSMILESPTSILLCDSQANYFRINRTTGDRTIIYATNSVDIAGTVPATCMVAEDSDNLFLAFPYHSVIVRHNLTTNVRTIVATLPLAAYPYGMTKLTNGNLLLVYANALYEVNPTNGNVTSVGSISSSYADLAEFPNGDFATVSFSTGLARIDPDNYFVQELANSSIGTGHTWSFPSAVAVNAGNWAYVFDSTEDAIVRVNPNTGNRTVLSRSTYYGPPAVGTGPAFRGYYGGGGTEALIVEGAAPSRVENWMNY